MTTLHVESSIHPTSQEDESVEMPVQNRHLAPEKEEERSTRFIHCPVPDAI